MKRHPWGGRSGTNSRPWTKLPRKRAAAAEERPDIGPPMSERDAAPVCIGLAGHDFKRVAAQAFFACGLEYDWSGPCS
jgi:hypothetical protein